MLLAGTTNREVWDRSYRRERTASPAHNLTIDVLCYLAIPDAGVESDAV